MPSAVVAQLVWELSRQLRACGSLDAEQTAGAMQARPSCSPKVSVHLAWQEQCPACALEGSSTALLAGSKQALRLKGMGPPVPEVSLL